MVGEKLFADITRTGTPRNCSTNWDKYGISRRNHPSLFPTQRAEFRVLIFQLLLFEKPTSAVCTFARTYGFTCQCVIRRCLAIFSRQLNRLLVYGMEIRGKSQVVLGIRIGQSKHAMGTQLRSSIPFQVAQRTTYLSPCNLNIG